MTGAQKRAFDRFIENAPDDIRLLASRPWFAGTARKDRSTTPRQLADALEKAAEEAETAFRVMRSLPYPAEAMRAYLETGSVSIAVRYGLSRRPQETGKKQEGGSRRHDTPHHGKKGGHA